MAQEMELAAPCGLYCGACPRYRAASDAALAERLAQAMSRPIEAVLCEGCRPRRGLIGDSPLCDTYACIQERKLEFCYECPDFPCLLLAPSADRATEIPHNMKIHNLLIAQKKGVQALADEAKDIWRTYFRGKKVRGGSQPEL